MQNPMSTNEKLAALRKRMAEHQLDGLYVNTADPHHSEYIADHFRERAWLTGFSGSAGYALLTRDAALLWVDGRYFIQAARQIAGSEFTLMKTGRPGVPTLYQWIEENLPQGARIGGNDACISQKEYEDFERHFKDQDIRLVGASSLIDELWTDRPALPADPIFLHPLQFTGATAAEKVQRVRSQMQADHGEAVIVVGLDDVAWLCNFRGNDVPNNPVALAYAVITQDQAFLFIDPAKVGAEAAAYFAENGIQLLPYAEINHIIHKLQVHSVVVEKARISHQLFRSFANDVRVIDRRSYVTMNKAQLNDTELACQRESYKRDSAIVARYLFWLKDRVKSGPINEYEAAEYLHSLRAAAENFIEDSFGAISAYGPNAAMMHYAPSAELSSPLEAHGLYLIDSGGQYFDGTTDITRTIALGPLTEEEKTDYTLTLKSHIQLARTIFMKGTSGHALDSIAREPLWRHGLDYKSGTGHAVGYVLGVHEGPQRISSGGSNVALLPGMVVTDEPGVYKEGQHGIRLENDLVVVPAMENMGDTFYTFEPLSYVPFDRTCILPELLSAEERDWLNAYHASCLEYLLERMSSEAERTALKAACAAI